MKSQSLGNIKTRWSSKTPKFFKNIIRFGIAVSIIAFSINEGMALAGAIEPIWWSNIYPYLIGVTAGMVAVSKLTREKIDEKEKEIGEIGSEGEIEEKPRRRRK